MTCVQPQLVFDKYEKRGAYHWDWYRRNTYRYRELVNRAIGYFPSSGSVLDIGCGDGLIAYKMFRRGLRVTGIDSGATAIEVGRAAIVHEFCRRHVLKCVGLRIARKCIVDELATLGLTLRNQSIYEMPEDERYDFVLCHEVIEHLRDVPGFLEKLRAVTREVAIISTPNGDFVSSHELDYHSWNPVSFVGLFAEFNARLVYIDEEKMFVRVDMR